MSIQIQVRMLSVGVIWDFYWILKHCRFDDGKSQ